MLESNEFNIVSTRYDKPLFIMRGISTFRFLIQISIYIFLTFAGLLFVIGKYHFQAGDSSGEFVFFLFVFLGLCYIDAYLVLSFFSKIKVYEDRLAITTLFLRKRIIPFSMIESVTPRFVFHQRYGSTIFISCNFKFRLTNGENIKFRASGNEKFYQLAQVLVEEFPQ